MMESIMKVKNRYVLIGMVQDSGLSCLIAIKYSLLVKCLRVKVKTNPG